MTKLELFSGTGGFHKGFLDAGFKFEKVLYSEINKHAIANYRYNFKKAIYAGSVTDIRGNELPEIDILTFGSPCQDFSIAGNGEGLNGKRSSLVWHAIRIITETRPSVFIWENVKGAYSSNRGRDFQAILQAFANIRSYRLEWQLLNTDWFLPQNRERIYLIGHLAGRSRPEVFPFREDDKMFNEGERQLPGKVRTKNDIANCLTKTMGNVQATGNFIKYTPVLSPDRKEKRQEGRRFKEVGDPAFTINCQDRHGVLIQDEVDQKIRRLTEIECERLQGFPDDWTKYGNYDGVIKEIAQTNRYEMIGNAVSTPAVKAIAERLKNCLI